MKTYLVSPRDDLVDFVAGLLHAGKDPSRGLVVFPGKRPAHFLRRRLAERAGHSLLSPRILSMDAFIDFMFDDMSGLSGKKINAIDAVAILFGIHRGYRNPLGGSGFIAAAAFLPLGLKLYRDLEELFIEGVTPDQVRNVDQVMGSSIPLESRERLQSLSFFYEGFYREVRERGLTTRSMRYCTVAEMALTQTLTVFDPIVLAGFFTFTRAERDLFRQIAVLEQSVSVFRQGPGIERTLDILDIRKNDFEDLRGGRQEVPGAVSFYRSPDVHGQIFGLNMILGEKGEAGAPDTLIVLPSSETLFPLVHNCAALTGESAYNISLGYPLVRTPVYGFLRSLAGVVTTRDGERIHVPAYLSLVLHPYTKNIYFKDRSDVTRMLFHALETELTIGQSTFVTLEEIEKSDCLRELAGQMGDMPVDVEDLRDHVREIHNHTIRKFLHCRDLEAFSENVIELLQYIYRQSTARLHPFFHPFSESLIEHLSLLRTSLLRDMSFEDVSEYFNFLRRYAASCHVPFEGTPLKGLQILGLLETRGLRFDRVFILDTNEDVLTGTGKEDSLFPDAVRRLLELPDYRERNNLTLYYLDVLVKGAMEAHLFYVEDGRKERSRFIEKLIWEKQKTGQIGEEEGEIRTVSYSMALQNRMPLPVPKDDGTLSVLRGFSFSATSLDRYLKCPLSFYYRYVLGLKTREHLQGDMEGQDVGRVVHECLQVYFERRKGRLLGPADIDVPEMDTTVDGVFSRFYGEELSGSLYLVKRQVRRHLARFLTRYQLPLLKERRVAILGLEYPIKGLWKGFRLAGRADRVETRDGDTFIIDYKTGGRPDPLRIRFDKLHGTSREKWPLLIGSLQLPFYLIAYSMATTSPSDTLHPLFLMLGKSTITEKIEEPLFVDHGGRAEGLRLLEGVMEKLLKEIIDPAVPFEPTLIGSKVCPWCEFQSLCGTRWMGK